MAFLDIFQGVFMKLNLSKLMGGTFGKIDGLGIKMTIQGLGIKASDGNIAVYDKEKNAIAAIPDDLTFGEVPVYAFPTNKFDVGDLIVHNNILKFVTKVNEDNSIEAVNIRDQVIQTIIPAKTMLGYFTASKVFTPFESLKLGGGEGGFDQNTLMALAMFGGDEDSDEDGLSSMLPLMLIGGGLGGKGDGKGFDLNSIIPILLMKDLL